MTPVLTCYATNNLVAHRKDRVLSLPKDQAPAHITQRVQLPEKVVLVWLPASSPELNPVERLWEDFKARIDVMDVRVRSSVSALQEHVAGIVQRYSAEIIASLTGYASLREAVHALQCSGYSTNRW